MRMTYIDIQNAVYRLQAALSCIRVCTLNSSLHDQTVALGHCCRQLLPVLVIAA